MPKRRTSVTLLSLGGLTLAFLAFDACTPRSGPGPMVPRPTTGATFGAGRNAGVALPAYGRVVKRLATCGTQTCKVDVWIGAYQGAHLADVNNPPNVPMRVALISNMGTYTTDMYDLQPNTVAEYDLYLQRDTAGTAQWELVPIYKVPGMAIVRKRGKAKGCGHRPATVDDADFRQCDSKGGSPIVMSSMEVPGMGLAVPALMIKAVTARIRAAQPPGQVEDPAWFSCSSGCCTAEPL